MARPIIVTEDKWRDGIKFLMGYGTNPTLSRADQKKLRECLRGPFSQGMNEEDAAKTLRNAIGWEKESPKLTPNQLAVMAAVLGVSNSGSDHLFHGSHPEFTPDKLRHAFGVRRSKLDVDSCTHHLVQGLCENEEMLENFQDEARSWVKTLSKMSVEKIKSTWPRYAAFVECVE